MLGVDQTREFVRLSTESLRRLLSMLNNFNDMPSEVLNILREFSDILEDTSSDTEALDEIVKEILNTSLAFVKIENHIAVRFAAGITMLSDVAAVRAFLRSRGIGGYSSVYVSDIDKLLEESSLRNAVYKLINEALRNEL